MHFTFYVRIWSLFQSFMNIYQHVIPIRLLPLPPWNVMWPTCNLQLVRHLRGKPSSLTYHWRFAEVLSVYWTMQWFTLTGHYFLVWLVVPSSVKARCYHISSTVLTAYLQPNSVPHIKLFCIFVGILDIVTSAQTPWVPFRVSIAAHLITPLLWEFFANSRTPLWQGGWLCFAGYLAIQACLVMGLLMQLLRRIPPMEFWHQNELLVVIIMLVFIMQFYHLGKTNALLHRTTDCR
jgi:hypothetical protein